MKRITLGLLMGLMALLPMGAASATQLGDPAPALSITDWVKGAPVDLAAG